MTVAWKPLPFGVALNVTWPMRRFLSALINAGIIGADPACAYRDPQIGYLPRTLGMGIAKRIIRYRINSWFLSSQLGTVGHTLRDGSQEKRRKKACNHRGIDRIL